MSNEIIESAESAINSGDIELAESMLPKIPEGGQFFVKSLISISQSDIESALDSVEKCINIVRSPKTRDAILEARAKMIRGLVRTSIGEVTEGGADLRWAMDRLGAISTGSDEHGISILNVAAWHRQQSEMVMSLATHSEIARELTHSPEIVAISRQRVASIHCELEDYVGALRHYWTSWKLSVECGIDAIAEVSCLHILDLGLTEVTETAIPLDEQIANATPRTKTGKSSAIIHPNDLLQALTWITPRSLEDISQKHRPDLSLIVESHNTLSIKLPEQLTDNIHLIQDPEVVKLLQ